MSDVDIDVSKAPDFGFSFEDGVEIDENELETLKNELQESEQLVKEYRNRMKKILTKVTILLNNLKSNPEKEMIKWPNRAKAIDDFLKELNRIYSGEDSTKE